MEGSYSEFRKITSELQAEIIVSTDVAFTLQRAYMDCIGRSILRDEGFFHAKYLHEKSLDAHAFAEEMLPRQRKSGAEYRKAIFYCIMLRFCKCGTE